MKYIYLLLAAFLPAFLLFLIYKIYGKLDSKTITILICFLFIIFSLTLGEVERYLPTSSDTAKGIFGEISISELKQIQIKGNETLRTFNPSITIIKDGSDTYKIISYRLSNNVRCPILSGKYNIIEKLTNDVMSHIVLNVQKNDEPASNIFLETPDLSYSNCISGFEDPRLIAIKDVLYIIVNSQSNAKCYSEMYLIKLKLSKIKEASGTIKINQITKLSYNENVDNHEKNWMPFVKDDKLMFVYSLNPHIILETNLQTGQCKKIAETENKEVSKDLRGSSQARPYVINDKNVYVGVGHIKHSTFAYLTQIYTFAAEKPYGIVSQTPMFVIKNTVNPEKVGVQFVSGLEIIGDTAYITYGEDDCDSKLLKIKMSNVIAKLKI